MSYPSVTTAKLSSAMAEVGAAWSWLEYLSPADMVRVAMLRSIVNAPDSADACRSGAMRALNEFQRVATERMSAAATPAPCSPPKEVPQPPPRPLDDLLEEMRARVSDLERLSKTPGYTKEMYKEYLDAHAIVNFAGRQRQTVLL
jgi:hypothetical protein